MELYRKYRASDLSGILGNETSVKAIQSIIDKKDRPHTFLFVGPAGCGKTTLAYILAKAFNLGTVTEYNSADYRGIDSVREFSEMLKYVPLTGTQGFIFEECFHEDTVVDTPFGGRAISTISKGDSVINANGEGVVTDVWTKDVSLEDIVRIDYNGTYVLCSRNHRIFTTEGWKYAGELTINDTIICISKEDSTNGQKSNDGISRCMRGMREDIHLSQTRKSLLFIELWNEVSQKAQTEYTNYLSRMSESILPMAGAEQCLLLNFLFKESMEQNSESHCASERPRNKEGYIGISQETGINRKGSGVGTKLLNQNETEQPSIYARSNRKDNTNQNSEWDVKHTCCTQDLHKLERQNCSTDETGNRVGARMGDGACHQNHRENASLVENRHCKPCTKDCGRSGRGNASSGIPKEERPTEGRRFVCARVEAVSFYKSGDSCERFGLCQEDIERGYATYYDLSVSGHPSYTVNNALVHNCHRMTNDAQEALLKPVENCPEHTYLFFTTTDASKLNAALKTRMVIITVEPLRDDQIIELVTSVCGKEDIKLEDDVVKHIASSAYGSPRRALTMLEKVIGLSHEDQLKVSGYAEEADTFAKDLCRIVVRDGKWEDVAAILSKLAVEPEAARRAVLGYLRGIMLRKDSPKAFVIAKHFTDNYYSTGNAGLVLSCYSAWMEFNSGE